MLLVEDNATDAELAMRVLARNNLATFVEVVTDGEAALQFLFATGAYADRGAARDPQVIVLDLKLPKVDGLEVLQRIKSDERMRRVPVVMLSSSREDRDVAECYRRGANSYVVKPIDPGEFEHAIAQVAYFWLKLNQPPV